MSLEAYRGESKKQDASLYPSYTRLTIPYRVICRQRYQKAGRNYQRQFLKEHSRLELIQPRALDGVRIHKEFCENILSPPTDEAMIKLTQIQERRLQYLMENTII